MSTNHDAVELDEVTEPDGEDDVDESVHDDAAWEHNAYDAEFTDAVYAGAWSSHAAEWSDRIDASDAREETLRRDSSWMGRIDVGVLWRAAWTDAGARRDEVLLVGTWRL